ncbi:hypothetical protein GCM10010921_31170 [Microbacterium album]|uniref:ABC transmembrane type-1 domain-containing protein n=1 Tax=Microbacterium album TaxID=2053191 RepID=A0A917IHG8_9MICO|nr:hypothetical protein GCM10010921_31170 [Microbacterium album]
MFALFPMLVIMVGLGLAPIVILGALWAVVAVITSTIDGLDSVPPLLLKLGAALRLSRVQQVTRVLVPAALRHIGIGLKLALTFSVIGVLASEFILSTYGLGHFIADAHQRFVIRALTQASRSWCC